MDTIEKATANDIHNYLRTAVKKKYENGKIYIYVIDYDETYVYFNEETYNDHKYYTETYRVSYVLDGVSVEIGDDKSGVAKETVYTLKESEESEDFVGKGLLKGIKDLLTEFSGTKPSTKSETHYIEKFQDEEMIAYEPLYVPPESGDFENEGMTEVELEKMVAIIKGKIDAGTMKANLFHKVPTESFTWIDAFTNPWPSCTIGSQEIAKGQPVGVCKYSNKKAWELRKKGVILGPSIEGKAGNKRGVDKEK